MQERAVISEGKNRATRGAETQRMGKRISSIKCKDMHFRQITGALI